MHILADGLMPLVEALFSHFATVERFDGRQPPADALARADALLVRSVTRVDEALLSQAHNLSFVGTATIGTDHLDLPALKRRGIAVSAAPGCNADAVADYVLSATLNWLALSGEEPRGLTVGVVGVGNIGSRVSRRLNALGFRVLHCDPPRAERGELDSTDLAELLPQVDLLTLHVPGGAGTRAMIGQEQLALLPQGALVINASRGDVIDGTALKAWLVAGRGQAVLDVFENEPDIDLELLELCWLATPHIAGHSIEGKYRGTWMLYEACCEHMGRLVSGSLEQHLPEPAVLGVTLGQGAEQLKSLTALMRLAYDIRDDDHWFRQGLAAGQTFDALRKAYPKRRELGAIKVWSDNKALEPLRAWGLQLQH
ncbi:4-phosphoerythronate dehydrogenase [Gallaecimonas sp. GXIMD4217]|uniref:4-phosphoerythronate dehydrogenase n=1 Tax=Gallaecimonas sp. GXIMD4217 TaxID=3131927 RepID=UPI00311B27D0